jgi:hypothetical protein
VWYRAEQGLSFLFQRGILRRLKEAAHHYLYPFTAQHAFCLHDLIVNVLVILG